MGFTTMATEYEIAFQLTREEAWEILSRCLTSHDKDNPLIASAMTKVARALEAREGRAPSHVA